VPAYGIDVDADVVTLCGAVDGRPQRDAAERIALRVSGVSEVRNRLKVWIAVSAPTGSRDGSRHGENEPRTGPAVPEHRKARWACEGVGDPGLEPGTSSLSEKRSNRLS
jgi:hypothetical protein